MINKSLVQALEHIRKAQEGLKPGREMRHLNIAIVCLSYVVAPEDVEDFERLSRLSSAELKAMAHDFAHTRHQAVMNSDS
jgi:hypothetical protein